MEVIVQYEDGAEESHPDFLDWAGSMLAEDWHPVLDPDEPYTDIAARVLEYNEDIFAIVFANGDSVDTSDIGYRAGWDSEEVEGYGRQW